MLNSGSWLPLGTYLKAVLTGSHVPPDVASKAAASSLFGQLAAADAFVPDLS